MSKKIVLMNDLPGRGKVALAAMMPVLTHMGHEVFNLPTAILSNTLDYGKFDLLDTTEYMKNTLRVWEELGFSFDAIATGFFVSEEQRRMMTEYCRKKAAQGAVIFADPIMGDEGRLYNSVTENTVQQMRELISAADYITPNDTEASFLAKVEYRAEGRTLEEYAKVIGKLRELGAKSVVITSAKVKGTDTKAVVGFDYKTNDHFHVSYEEVPIRFPGTGDLFAALLIGAVMNGEALEKATRYAVERLEKMIQRNLCQMEEYKGIPVEQFLEEEREDD